jgi:hypothetical protein
MCNPRDGGLRHLLKPQLQRRDHSSAEIVLFQSHCDFTQPSEEAHNVDRRLTGGKQRCNLVFRAQPITPFPALDECR